MVLLPLAAILGAALEWADGGTPGAVLLRALNLGLVLFLSWALARELDPDDQSVAFISLAAGVLVGMLLDSPGLLAAVATLGLIRVVNRSTGLPARKSDSVALVLLTIAVIYSTGSPLFGGVAALAFVLDGSLKEPLRHQWVFALVCLGGMVVYLVDHDGGLGLPGTPNSLFEWLSVLFLLMFALDILLTRRIRSRGDINDRPLLVGRVRGGMAVGLLAAMQSVDRPENVAVIVAAIAGICVGMAFRKGFRAPAAQG